MIGRTFEGTYTANSLILRYIKMGSIAVAGCSALLAIIGIMTGNNWIVGGALAMMAICVLTYMFITKFIRFKPKECSITLESVDKGVLTIIIKGNEIEDMKVYSNSGTWNRDNLIMTLIDGNGSAISFRADKNEYKMLRQENVDVAVGTNG